MSIIKVTVNFEECELTYPSWTRYDGSTEVPPPEWSQLDDYMVAIDGLNGEMIVSTYSEGSFG